MFFRKKPQHMCIPLQQSHSIKGHILPLTYMGGSYSLQREFSLSSDGQDIDFNFCKYFKKEVA